MTRGLVIGKFLPPHKGHLALIELASRQCDTVIVSMSDAPSDPIDIKLRVGWLKEATAHLHNVRVAVLKDDFDKEDLPLQERTVIWAHIVGRAYGQIDRVFSSEEYGEYLARNLGAISVEFDQERKLFPVSASRIRMDPFKYWDFIPEVVRPYYLKKICFFGPESTGKSVMARRMAERYNTLFVPEVARELVTSNSFSTDDIIRIGKAQTDRILELSKKANRFLFCDTDLITTQIYSKHYLNAVPEILYELEKKVVYDQYFFFDIDVPWVEDGLRDLGHRREEMRGVFMKELEKRKIKFILVSGSFEEREKTIASSLPNL